MCDSSIILISTTPPLEMLISCHACCTPAENVKVTVCYGINALPLEEAHTCAWYSMGQNGGGTYMCMVFNGTEWRRHIHVHGIQWDRMEEAHTCAWYSMRQNLVKRAARDGGSEDRAGG